MSTAHDRILRVSGLVVLAALCAFSFSALAEEQTPLGEALTDLHGDPLPPGALARLGTVRFRIRGEVRSLALSPDGKWLALAPASEEESESLAVCDAASGKVVFQPKGIEQEARAVAFSPDGRLLAAGYGDGKIRLWEAGTWKPSRTLEGPEQGVVSMSFTRDGRLASCDDDGKARVWDVEQGQVIVELKLEEERASVVGFSPDDRALAVGCHEGAVLLVDANTGKVTRKLDGHDRQVTALAFSPDGKALASGGEDEMVRCWDLGTGVNVFAGEGEDDVGAVAFTTDGRFLVSGDHNGWVRSWDPGTGQEIRRFTACMSENSEKINGLALSPDDKTVYAAGEKLIWRWKTETGERLREPPGHEAEVCELAFSGDGLRVASTGEDGTLRVWDAATGRQLYALQIKNYVQPPVFSPDGKLLAHAGDVLHVWEAETGRPVACGKGTGRNLDIMFHPDGRTVLGVSGKDLAQWEAATGRLLRTIPWPVESGERLWFLPGGQTALQLAKKKLHFIETAGARVFGEHDVPWRQAAVLVPSGDGGLVYSFAEQEISVWEIASARRLHKFPGERAPCRAALSRDGRCLVLAAVSGKLPILDAFSGAKLLDLEDGQRTGAVAFSPDGRRLATGGLDTTILIWDWEAIARRLPAPPPAAAADLEKWFAALAGEDGAAACEALGKLLANGAPSVAFLKERLRPVTPDPARMRQLIAELDHEDFNTREKAAETLRDLGPPAEPALRRALAENQSTEVQMRAKKILDAIALPLARSRELLRNLRVIRILEGVGTAEAAGALEAFARTAPETREGRAAGAAAERLQNADVR